MSHLLDVFCDTQTILSSNAAISQSRYRLDASFYKNHSLSDFIKLFTDSMKLAEICQKVFNPVVFKRDFQSDIVGSCRYLASSEIISWFPELTYISNAQAERLDLKVHKGWVLVTGFGTIGSVRIVDSSLDGVAIANNIARIVLKYPDKHSGFIAAFLSSSVGQALLNDRASGSVVRYIEAPGISETPIPLLPESVASIINEKYLQALKYREQSIQLIQEADSLILELNGLPDLYHEAIKINDNGQDIESILVSSLQISQMTGEGTEYRLDANYYNSRAQRAVNNLKECNSSLMTVNGLSKRVILGPRFKRTYVDPNYGTPFLSGKNITQIRPTDLKYLSNSETPNLTELLVERGWILVTCSGTIGRTCFVWHNYEKYAASQHILRIVPDSETIDPGYLFAFLSSPYGYEQIYRFRHGSVIDEITDKQIEKVLVAYPSKEKQETIGNKVRLAYEKRVEAINLEDKAQAILDNELTKGVEVR